MSHCNKTIYFFCDKFLQCWFNGNKKDIPKCLGCSEFVKEPKVWLLMERIIDFSEQSNPSNDDEEMYRELAKKLKTFVMSNTNKFLLPKVKLRQ